MLVCPWMLRMVSDQKMPTLGLCIFLSRHPKAQFSEMIVLRLLNVNIGYRLSNSGLSIIQVLRLRIAMKNWLICAPGFGGIKM